MDIERLIGAPIYSIDGVAIGEIVGIELYGTKIHLIIDSDFDFGHDGGPDGDGGQEVPVETVETGKDEPTIGEKVVNLDNYRKVG